MQFLQIKCLYVVSMHVPLSGSWFSGLPGLRSLSPADKSCIISSLAQMITWPRYYLFNYYCTLTLCLQFRHFHRWQIFWCLFHAMESKVVLPYIVFSLRQIISGRGKAMHIWLDNHLCIYIYKNEILGVLVPIFYL